MLFNNTHGISMTISFVISISICNRINIFIAIYVIILNINKIYHIL